MHRPLDGEIPTAGTPRRETREDLVWRGRHCTGAERGMERVDQFFPIIRIVFFWGSKLGSLLYGNLHRANRWGRLSPCMEHREFFEKLAFFTTNPELKGNVSCKGVQGFRFPSTSFPGNILSVAKASWP